MFIFVTGRCQPVIFEISPLGHGTSGEASPVLLHKKPALHGRQAASEVCLKRDWYVPAGQAWFPFTPVQYLPGCEYVKRWGWCSGDKGQMENLTKCIVK